MKKLLLLGGLGAAAFLFFWPKKKTIAPPKEYSKEAWDDYALSLGIIPQTTEEWRAGQDQMILQILYENGRFNENTINWYRQATMSGDNAIDYIVNNSTGERLFHPYDSGVVQTGTESVLVEEEQVVYGPQEPTEWWL